MKLYTLKEAQDILGIKENTLKQKIFVTKSIRSIKIGKDRFVSRYDLDKYVERLEWKKKHPAKKKQSPTSILIEYKQGGRKMAHAALAKKRKK